MSNEATNWAWEQAISKASYKFVLLALAKRACNEKQLAFPSIDRICDDTAMNRKTVIAALDALESLGLIMDTGSRRGQSGKVKVYQVLVGRKAVIVPKTESSQKRDSTKNGIVPILPEDSTKNGTVDSTKNGTQNLSVELTKESIKKINKKSSTTEQRFASWYAQYPNKKSRARALKAFTRLNPDDLLLQRMIHALKSQIENRARAKAAGVWAPDWKHPETWLNGQCWEDSLIEIPDPHTGGNHGKTNFTTSAPRLSTVDRQHAIVRQRHAQREGEHGSGRFSDAVVAAYE